MLLCVCVCCLWKKRNWEWSQCLESVSKQANELGLNWIQFSCSVVCDSLWPHRLQHARLPCPLATPGAYSNSYPSSRWCRPTISSSVLFSCLQSFPASGSFSNESVLRIRWPKYWSFSFSISPSNEYSGFISFRIDWFVLPAVQRTLQHHSTKASVLQHSF